MKVVDLDEGVFIPQGVDLAHVGVGRDEFREERSGLD
jgi:hypothetical protein